MTVDLILTMKIGYFILNDGLREDPSVTGLLSDLEAASY